MGGGRCSLSYIDRCVVFCSQVARLELHIETANVGADTGRPDRERFQGEEKRSLSLSTFSPFPPPPVSQLG